MSMSENIDAFLSKRTTAERDGGVEALKALADDFYGVGPLGFVLPRTAWLDRHRQGLAAIHMNFLAGARGAPPMRVPDNPAGSGAQTIAVGEGR
ncbi:MAG: hypothetical protein WA695_05755 [Candidatus Dormiibacterota bacterium]